MYKSIQWPCYKRSFS